MAQENSLKDSIHHLMDSFVESIREERNTTMEKFEEKLIDIGFRPDMSPCDFYLLGLYDYKNLLSEYVNQRITSNPVALFIFTEYPWLERSILKLIIDAEGTAMSHDKLRAIIEVAMAYYKDNKTINWDYNGKYTFHLPKKVFTKHEQVISFIDAMYDLRNGDPSNLILWYSSNT